MFTEDIAQAISSFAIYIFRYTLMIEQNACVLYNTIRRKNI